MTRLALLAAASLLALAVPASADCTLEVVQAFARLGNEKAVRKVQNVIGEQGPVVMTIEYVKPDRMRQVVTKVIDPDNRVETVLIGKDAWGNGGKGWVKLVEDDAKQFREFFKRTTESASDMVGLFECMGAETIDGQKVRAYRGLPPKTADKPEDKKTTEEKSAEATIAANEAVRVVYLDPETGLPARAIFAVRDKLDRPIFREVFTYPTDLKIDPPPAPKN
ncbi:MAG: hypothetical protein NW216_15050 [Hyphomicrobium sp.]|nr:hypothetical protein [Hyphomicrobium sp.]